MSDGLINDGPKLMYWGREMKFITPHQEMFFKQHPPSLSPDKVAEAFNDLFPTLHLVHRDTYVNRGIEQQYYVTDVDVGVDGFETLSPEDSERWYKGFLRLYFNVDQANEMSSLSFMTMALFNDSPLALPPSIIAPKEDQMLSLRQFIRRYQKRLEVLGESINKYIINV